MSKWGKRTKRINVGFGDERLNHIDPNCISKESVDRLVPMNKEKVPTVLERTGVVRVGTREVLKFRELARWYSWSIRAYVEVRWREKGGRKGINGPS